MAAALAMYPQMKEMFSKFQAQQVDMTGAPILTVMTMEAVSSPEQAAANEKKQDEGGGNITSVRGLGGLIGRKIAGKKEDQPAAKNRATILTMNHELLKVASAAGESDTAIPAGFKEKK